jgi:glutathione S-transferase
MRLYVIPGAPNCRKVQALALELGLALDTVRLDLRAGDTDKPGYRALNPNGYTPTLVDGEFVLSESNAIIQYLCAQRPGTPLWPDAPRARADIVRWQFWEQANLQRPVGTLLRENFLKPRYFNQPPDPARVNEVAGPFHRFAAILDRHLHGRRFVVGDSLTLADFSLAAAFCYAGPAQLPWQDYANIQSWYAGIDGLASWQATRPQRAPVPADA